MILKGEGKAVQEHVSSVMHVKKQEQFAVRQANVPRRGGVGIITVIHHKILIPPSRRMNEVKTLKAT